MLKGTEMNGKMILSVKTSKREIWIHACDQHRFTMLRLLNEAVFKMEQARNVLIAKKRGTKLVDRRIASVQSQVSELLRQIKPQIVREISK
jgi:hypothetical protein